jgi:glutathione S-transferase
MATAAASFVFRGTSGAVAAGYAVKYEEDDGAAGYAVLRAGGKKTVESSIVATFPRPAQPLELFEFEGCPFCKRVREAAVYFDLDIVFYPCPRDGPNYRPQANAEGGKKQFPYMRDPNTGVAMYESDAICAYFAEKYGDGVVPSALRGPLAPLLIGLGLLPRGGRGSKYRASKATPAMKPLVLWAYEASPFCKLVREVLNELEIPHLLKTAARGSPKRDELFAKTGHFQARGAASAAVARAAASYEPRVCVLFAARRCLTWRIPTPGAACSSPCSSWNISRRRTRREA